MVRSLLGEINNRSICSSEISAREDAMRKACSLMREGHAGRNDDMVDCCSEAFQR